MHRVQCLFLLVINQQSKSLPFSFDDRMYQPHCVPSALCGLMLSPQEGFLPVTALVILLAPASDDEGSTAATDGSTLRTSPAEHGGSVGSESGGSAVDSVAGEHSGNVAGGPDLPGQGREHTRSLCPGSGGWCQAREVLRAR